MKIPEKLLDKAHRIADHYGEVAQVDMLIEEMSELTKALLKNRRARHGQTDTPVRATVNAIEEEVADVLIMLNQIIYLGDFEDLEDIIEEKLDRQLERIEAEKEQQ
ncbi:hypothetical protein [Intestinibacter sp.]|uniref:hypothetical protein n=1 Tax=Intestinibacter sp. TaxID=1965304 RepID=UPI002A75EBCD|nr:hypothetical protein [Intestinibacter sp.]MDY2734516.1 hypothetical protein [Intestinibacter sp.]